MHNEHEEIAESGLTDKQERFAHEYLIDQNASAAALRAGYSANSHRVQASQLMRNPEVRRRVKELLEELYDQIKVSALTLMQERLKTAFFDPRTLVDADSKPIPVKAWDDDAACVMLVSFDVRANGETVLRARQPSRGAALSALERRFANFMKLQEENTITERERDDLHRSVGRDPATVKPGDVVRFTPERVRRAESEVGSQPAAQVGASMDPHQPVAVAPQPEPIPVRLPEPEPDPMLDRAFVQRAIAALTEPGRVRPQRVREDKYWCDLDGNINVDHPACPPEVRARELEKRARREAGNRA
jgi:phage terminase small subunit